MKKLICIIICIISKSIICMQEPTPEHLTAVSVVQCAQQQSQLIAHQQPLLTGTNRKRKRKPTSKKQKGAKKKDNRYHCTHPGCTKSYVQKGHLVRHNRTAHQGEMFECPDCKKKMTTKHSLKHHRESIHEKKRYSCRKCNELFSSKSGLKRHEYAIHYKKRYYCSLPGCDKSYARQDSLKEHELSHEGKRYLCSDCGKSFSKARVLAVHKASVHKGIKHKCTHCKQLFSTKGGLGRHVSTAHEGKKYYCPYSDCERFFKSRNGLILHKNSTHKKIKYPCLDCDKSFAGKGALKQHTNFVHCGGGYPCPICDKLHLSPASVRSHIRSTHKQKFKCSYPIFKKTESNSNNHGKNSYSWCKESFNTQRDLDNHQEEVHAPRNPQHHRTPQDISSLNQPIHSEPSKHASTEVDDEMDKFLNYTSSDLTLWQNLFLDSQSKDLDDY